MFSQVSKFRYKESATSALAVKYHDITVIYDKE